MTIRIFPARRVLYPGCVGELAHRELTAHADFGYRFAGDVNGQLDLPAGGQKFSPLVARCFSPAAAR